LYSKIKKFAIKNPQITDFYFIANPSHDNMHQPPLATLGIPGTDYVYHAMAATRRNYHDRRNAHDGVIDIVRLKPDPLWSYSAQLRFD